jgi:pimeloyl-ACP methyl ester carboxylesterase
LLFIEALGIQKASLVGHSMGGGTAIKFSIHYRDKVNKLVLVDSTGIPNPLPLRSKFFNLPGVGELLLGVNNNYLRRKNLEEIWLHKKEQLSDEMFDKVIQFQKVRGTSEVVLQILRKEFFHTLGSEINQLGQMDIPTLIIWGRHDVSIPIKIGEEMHKIIKGSKFEIIDEGGHMPNFDCPDLFNQLVKNFI